jgi:hypothetical protein
MINDIVYSIQFWYISMDKMFSSLRAIFLLIQLFPFSFYLSWYWQYFFYAYFFMTKHVCLISQASLHWSFYIWLYGSFDHLLNFFCIVNLFIKFLSSFRWFWFYLSDLLLVRWFWLLMEWTNCHIMSTLHIYSWTCFINISRGSGVGPGHSIISWQCRGL